MYLVRPSIYPDQIWATRDLVTFVLPCLVLFAVTTAVVLVRAARRASPALPPWLVPAVAAVALLLPTVLTTWRVRELTDQAGHLDALEDLCTAMGPDAAVTLVVQARYWDLTYLQPITAWCGVPAAGLPVDTPASEIEALAEAWRQQGRTLQLVASTSDADGPSALDRFTQVGLADPAPDAPPRERPLLAHTFDGPPSTYWSVPIAWDVAPVTAPAG